MATGPRMRWPSHEQERYGNSTIEIVIQTKFLSGNTLQLKTHTCRWELYSNGR
jgi:hypothetical protein